jgi:hypothetical protein
VCICLSIAFYFRYNISRAIQFWAGVGVDGISLLGLDQYGADPFILDALLAWNSNFEQFASGASIGQSHQRIFTTSYQLAENIDRQLEGRQAAELFPPSAALKARVGSGAEAVAHFALLDASLDVVSDQLDAEKGEAMAESLRAATRWDRTPARPWIAWQVGRAGPEAAGRPTLLSPAKLAFQLFLPGTVSLSWASLDADSLARHNTSSLLGMLSPIQRPWKCVFMLFSCNKLFSYMQ